MNHFLAIHKNVNYFLVIHQNDIFSLPRVEIQGNTSKSNENIYILIKVFLVLPQNMSGFLSIRQCINGSLAFYPNINGFLLFILV